MKPPLIRRALGASRFLVLIAVLGTLAAAVILFVYGAAETVGVLLDLIAKPEVSAKGAKALVLSFIEIVDVFLLGTVLVIIALGLYELFVDPEIVTPEWLHIRTLDDLKSKLVGVVIVVLAVLFLGQAVSWNGERDLLRFGAAVALVIAALTYFLATSKAKKD